MKEGVTTHADGYFWHYYIYSQSQESGNKSQFHKPLLSKRRTFQDIQANKSVHLSCLSSLTIDSQYIMYYNATSIHSFVEHRILKYCYVDMFGECTEASSVVTVRKQSLHGRQSFSEVFTDED